MIRTVLGDVAGHALGPTNYHEHVFQATPLLPGDELDDLDAGVTELGHLRASGFAAMIDATPVGLGRRSAALAEASARSGVTIVATTGLHRDAHYSDQPWLLAASTAALEAIFVRELTVGLAERDTDYAERRPDDVSIATHAGQPVRAGVLKAGIEYWRISPAERRTLEAVAAAHRATGAPVMVHTEACTATHEVLDLLQAEGTPPSSVALAHVDRNPDAGLHAELAARGAHLGYDGAGRAKDAPDSVLLDALASLVEAGHGDRILLGADVARRSRYRAYGGLPGLEYLGVRFVPRLRARVGDAATDTMVVSNPARYLTWQRKDT